MIATLSEFKLYIWVDSEDTSKDSILNIFLDWANSLVESYISRKIEATEYEEIIDGDGQLFWMLENIPVIKINWVYRNSWTLETAVWEEMGKWSYSVKSSIGKLNFFWPLARGFKNYKISYKAGFDEIPWDLKLAVLKLASRYYNTKESDWIVSESVAWDSISFNVSQIPSDILGILSIYRDL